MQRGRKRKPRPQNQENRYSSSSVGKSHAKPLQPIFINDINFLRYKNKLQCPSGTPLRYVACHVFCSSFLFLTAAFPVLQVSPLHTSHLHSAHLQSSRCPYQARLRIATGCGSVMPFVPDTQAVLKTKVTPVPCRKQ
jgi:hypothetical protein